MVQAGARGPDGVVAEVFDPLGDFDPGPLAEVVADPAIRVLMHAGRQDVALLRRHWEIDVTNLFDTQIAAGFAGYGNQTSHTDIVRSLLKVRVPKSEGFTRWETRPLTEEQIEYARADVEYLPDVADILTERLERSGRLEWALEECRALESASDERSAEIAYQGLPRLGRLTDQQRALAFELASWRDETARKIDRPPPSVMPDHVLWEIARRAPTDRKALSQIRGMPERTLGRHHQEIAEAVRRGKQAEPIPHEERRSDPDRGDAPLVALCQALVRQRALDSEIAVEFVATQADLSRIVMRRRMGEDTGDIRPLFGWRREMVGDDLIALLEGRMLARIAGGKLSFERT